MLNLKPSYLAEGNINDISFDVFREHGVNCLLIDLDNTLMIRQEGTMRQSIIDWLREALRLGFKLMVVTNNNRRDYLKGVQGILDKYSLKMISDAGKPSPSKLQQAMEMLDAKSEETCLIGDRVLTDIWGGQKAQIKTILVPPLSGREEFWLLRFLRQIEYLFLDKSVERPSV